MHTLAITRFIGDLGCAIAINANLVAVDDFKTRLIGLAKVAVCVSWGYPKMLVTYPRALRTTASASSSTSM